MRCGERRRGERGLLLWGDGKLDAAGNQGRLVLADIVTEEGEEFGNWDLLLHSSKWGGGGGRKGEEKEGEENKEKKKLSVNNI